MISKTSIPNELLATRKDLWQLDKEETEVTVQINDLKRQRTEIKTKVRKTRYKEDELFKSWAREHK